MQYWEPAKYVARLRRLKTDSNPLLFSIDMEAGHAGASGWRQKKRDTAAMYAFFLACLEGPVTGQFNTPPTYNTKQTP